MKVWWCNQRHSWEEESSERVVRSGSETHQLKYRRMVFEASVGDIVVHYVGGQGIMAVSCVTSKAVKCAPGDTRKICRHGAGWAFRTKYHIFEHPIPIDNLRIPLFGLEIEDGPLRRDKNLGATGKEGYFMRFSWAGLELIYRSASEQNWPDYVIQGLDSDRNDNMLDLTMRAQEGTLTELRGKGRLRNRALRDQAFRAGKGICAVCRRDFNKLLKGAGLRSLQVHHLKQLAASDEPVLTAVEDLAVVCANCHALIHQDPKRALTIKELQDRLKGEGYLVDEMQEDALLLPSRI